MFNTTRAAVLAFAASLVACLAPATAAVATSPLEDAIKATYVYKFAGFIEWPPAAFPSPSSPLTLCVLDDAPFVTLLEQAVAGRHLNQHPMAVRRLQTATSQSGCQIMYIRGSDRQSAAQALEAVRGSPILTITDTPSEADKGIINFIVQSNHVRFEIDVAMAQASGLTISSKLLSLAVNVRPKS